MKSLVVQALKSDPAIGLAVTSAGEEARIYSVSALGREGTGGVPSIPALPIKPFLIVMEMPTVPHQAVQETSKAADYPIRVSVYDVPGDYESINALLRAVRNRILLVVGEQDPLDGVYCMGSRWTGFSQELQDPEYDSNLRYASFVLTASR